MYLNITIWRWEQLIKEKLASSLGTREEKPNIELAHELVKSENIAGIEEVMQLLQNADKKIKHDCIKVAYEVCRLNSELIKNYAPIFIQLLRSPSNRLIWGAMQALSTIAIDSHEILMDNLHELKLAVKTGSVITVDKGILTLSKLASISEEYNEKIFPFLIQHLKNCSSKEFPQHAESSYLAVNNKNKQEYVQLLKERLPYLSPAKAKRIKKLLKLLNEVD